MLIFAILALLLKDVPDAAWGAGAVVLAAAIGTLNIVVGKLAADRATKATHEATKELRPNGGGSIYDVVNKMSEKLDTVVTDLGTVKEQVSRFQGRFDQQDADAGIREKYQSKYRAEMRENFNQPEEAEPQ